MSDSLIIGTRGSALALVQTHWVRDALAALHPHLDIHVMIIQTTGDKSQSTNTPLASYTEKGIFAKEIEVALQGGEIHLAVHSMKDMAAVLPDGLHIAAVPKRANAADALVGMPLAELQPGDRIGTGSVRRSALLRALRPDLNIADIRGNVDTRITKLRNGDYESIVLAAAGLDRLGLSSAIVEVLDPATFVPDPGQGALAIQCRLSDDRTNTLLAPLNHLHSMAAIAAERAYLAEYGGGCQTPVGAWATVSGKKLTLTAMAALDGAPHFTVQSGLLDEPDALGQLAARVLRSDIF